MIKGLVVSALLSIILVGCSQPEKTAVIQPAEQATATNNNKANPEIRPVINTKTAGPGIVMIEIPGGSFQMGSDVGSTKTKPAHTVALNNFYLSEAEVTIRQYAAFLSEVKPDPTKLQQWILLGEPTHIITQNNNYYPVNGWEEHPVVNVSWFGAKAFCDHYGLRLPSEAEWEYAAGGPSHYRFPWGNDFTGVETGLCCYQVSKGAGFPSTMMVKSFPSNGFGIYDMAGNIMEWCNDWYDSYNVENPNNPQGPQTGTHKTIRGGFFNSGADGVECVFRVGSEPGRKANYIGFRVAGN